MKQQTFIDLPFLGRKHELAFLNNRYDQACEYQGNSLLIIGDPGIGKTRLVEEFLSQHPADCQSLNTRVTQSTSHAIDLFVAVLRSYLAQSTYTARTITRVIDRNMYEALAGLMPDLKTYYPYEPKKTVAPIKSTYINEYFFRFILNLSHFTPVILTIEDLHMSFFELRGMFKHLIQNIQQQPIMCVFTSRPNKEVATWFRNIPIKQREILTLQGLQKENIIGLNQELFGNSVEDLFFGWLSEKTKGVPLFLREFLYALIEKGIILYDDESEQWQIIESYRDIAVPKAVTDLIQTKLNMLSPAEIEYLQYAAIIGDEFDPTIPFLQDKYKLIPRFIRKGLIKENKDVCRFSHPLVWEIVYNHIPEHNRYTLHRKLGNHFRDRGDKVSAINQYLHAQIETKWLFNMLLKTAIRMKKEHRCAVCLKYFKKALEMTRVLKNIPEPVILNIMIHYSECLFCKAQHEEAAELAKLLSRSLHKNHRKLTDSEKIYAYQVLSEINMWTGKHDEALKYANRGIALVGNNKAYKAALAITIFLRVKMDVYMADMQLKMALRAVLSFNSYFKAIRNYHIIYKYQSILGSIYKNLSDSKKALYHNKLALNAAIRMRNYPGIAAVQGNIGQVYLNMGEYKKAEEQLLLYRRSAIDRGRLKAYIISCMILGEIYMRQGFFSRAENECINGIKRCMETGAKSLQTFIERNFSENLIYEERFEEAFIHIQTGIEMAKSLGLRLLLLEIQYYKGLFHFAKNEKNALKKVIVELERAPEITGIIEPRHAILSGLYEILNGSVNRGLKILHQQLDILETRDIQYSIFSILYLCSRRFRSLKVPQEKIDKYANRAIKIAKQHRMEGWLEKLCPEKEPAPKQPLKISCLGSLMIEHPITGQVDLNQLEWAKPRQIFSILLTSYLAGEKINKEKIAVLLWPELSAKKVTNVFHVTLSSLKKAIGREYLRYQNRAYELFDVDIDSIDFKRFIADAETLLRSGKIHTAETNLNRALDLYRGDFLKDYYDMWLDPVRHELSGLYRKGLLLLGNILLQKLRLTEAEEIGKKLLQRDPFDEEGHRFLMRSYVAAGEKALAIQQYDRCFRMFMEQLHCQPSEQTRQLYDDIKK
jgi:two-component SAPR family response regulator